MRSITRLGLLALTLLCLFSCNKKKTTTLIYNQYSGSSAPTQKKISLPITIGSYWVYDMEYVDINTQSRTFMGRDSFVVENNIVINNRNYKQVKKYSVVGSNPLIGPAIDGSFRDSSGFNITPNGTFFDQSDFSKTTITYVSGGSIETRLLNSGKIYTNFGSYNNTVNYCSKYQAVSGNTGVRYMNNYYADNIGLVQATSFYISDTDHYIEKSLIRYSIK